MEEYDRYSIDSIVEYATKLVGHTLREYVTVEQIADFHTRKGSYGNAVEEYYFKYRPNSDSRPAFSEVGLELKTTPVKKNSRGELVAKERLVFTMIDYEAVVNESFEDSQFLKKARDVLLITYLSEPDKEPLDYVIEAVVRCPRKIFLRLSRTGRPLSIRYGRATRRTSLGAIRCISKPQQRLGPQRTVARSRSPTSPLSHAHGHSRALT